MNKQTVEEVMNTFYPIEIHYIKTKEDGYYWAFIKDFGASACSATGDTIEETLKSLEKVKREVVTYIIEEKGEILPSPSTHVFLIDNEKIKEFIKKEWSTLDYVQAVFIFISDYCYHVYTIVPEFRGKHFIDIMKKEFHLEKLFPNINFNFKIKATQEHLTIYNTVPSNFELVFIKNSD